TITAVPEPGSWTMLMAGLGMMGFMIRRRRAS
ncbi:MAG: PEP-CTERM sorting domain-containing protein, partial [Rhodocyclales bacterium CG17_big_fil_post_rev_8_21_14_2_50_68_7]